MRAGYWMLDTPVVPNVRVVGGVRVETTDISVFSRSYQASEITGELTNSTDLSEAKLLPSASVVWGMASNMNLRLSYSQTLARPSFRELAAVRSYDPILDELIEGNPRLRMVDSENYDARWEWFFRPGELVSVSVFYKELQNAIEKIYVTVTGDVVSFVNRPESKVYGAEVELRKNLGFLSPHLDLFSLGANFSFIESETEWSDAEFEVKKAQVADAEKERPLFDQSPYIINVDLSYDNPRSGTSASLVFNVAGPRISITSLNSPDVYDQPAPTLDFILSQRLGKHLAIKMSVKNILNPDIKRTYGEDEEALRSTYTKGLTFGVGLSYDF